ncbi:ribonuclease H-like protein [Pisolithus tinctorius]|nr:ribonuclease H-like protein [Pisolithus tinctorius]
MPKAPKLAYYAVRKGRQPGIYLSWYVKGFAGAVFKKFPTEALAETFMHAVAWDGLSAPSNHQPASSTSAVVARVAPSTGTPDADEKEFDVVYCDGACKGNGATGSKAGIGVWWGHNDPRNLSERCPGDQTNNRAELIVRVSYFAWHDLTVPGYRVTSWIFKWMTNGFRTSDGQPVKNRPVLKYLAALLHARHITSQTVEFKHVRGHVGLEGNEAADRLANIGVLQPPLPERDWEQLEQNVSKNIRQEEKQLDEDLQAYADGLLDDDELVCLSNTSIGNTQPPQSPTRPPVSTTSSTDVNRSIRPPKATIPAIAHSSPASVVRKDAELQDYASCLLSNSQLAAEMAADGEFPSDY